MINKEIENALLGKDAWMILKMNSLVDEDMIKKLYEASSAGVKIRLIVRGICSLIPGVPGLSENIKAISIVDIFLEHSRIFIFCHGGEEKYFLSSGDWMNRNLDFRSEVTVPIYDHELQAQLMEYVKIQFQDNSKARFHSPENVNEYVHNSKRTFKAQDEIYKWILNLQSQQSRLPKELNGKVSSLKSAKRKNSTSPIRIQKLKS